MGTPGVPVNFVHSGGLAVWGAQEVYWLKLGQGSNSHESISELEIDRLCERHGCRQHLPGKLPPESVEWSHWRCLWTAVDLGFGAWLTGKGKRAHSI